MLANVGTMFKTIDDHYYALIMHKRVSKYGDTPKSDAFFNYLMNHAASKWMINGFEAESWKLEGNSFNETTARFAEIMATLMSKAGMRKEVDKFLTTAFASLEKSAYY